ncbi:glycosyltransferase [Salinibacterium soli]|uniref:Glycosyltransferase n=1 Tax=Antiquaquibacter soli TaxID=3064523 RepID=A0ABT9BJ29_9MICO|nr:glycosyltransferase [Protaetiibacter sp. WY-16]MDO7881026.1 glycosyltransferase [Protaetiibacter sp. WY-16]
MRRSVAIIGSRGYPSFYGGFETAVRHLAPYLADRGWDVTVYGRRGQTVDALADPRVHRVATDGIESTSLSTLSHGFTATIAALRARHDVALVMNVANGYFLPLLRLGRIPTVVNVDGVEWERAKWGQLARFVFRLGARLTRLAATTLVVDARAIGDYWQRTLGRGGVFIPYGADAPGPLPVMDSLIDGAYILFVARLVPENSVHQFLDAVEELDAAVPVVVVGAPPVGDTVVTPRLEDLARRRASFHWLGQVSDDDLLFGLWQHAGVYVHGHTVGGTNPALVQAMACGAPVVARDTVFNREVLGETGVFVGDSSRELSDAIKGMLASPADRARLSAAASARAASSYSWPSVLEAYERELVSAADRQARAAGRR